MMSHLQLSAEPQGPPAPPPPPTLLPPIIRVQEVAKTVHVNGLCLFCFVFLLVTVQRQNLLPR